MARVSSTLLSYVLNAIDGTATLANRIGFIALHTADPGTNGANEYAGVTRQPVTWSASSGGSAKTNTNTLSFTTNGASDVTHASAQDLASGASSHIWGIVLTGPVRAANIVAAPGALTLSAA